MGETMRPLFVPMIAVVVPQLSGSLIIFGSANRIPHQLANQAKAIGGPATGRIEFNCCNEICQCSF